ncbi:hypothetical protein IJJ36_04060 [Candidatus Saccharibacteria bacterium]|nr:hypothetical protein [Candidatus Saccharibacteria bacterium]
MTFYKQNDVRKKEAVNTDPLFMLTDLLMKIDQRKKIIPIPKEYDDDKNS